jgi:Zn-dependent protease
MEAIDTIFYIAILIMSVVIHEVSHGFVAEHFGDTTARNAGRLTLNPLPHLDLFGSIILPALLIVTHAGFLLGWAKPVPYNPDNFRDRRLGTLAVAAAGVSANFLLAFIFGFLIRFAPRFTDVPPGFYFITSAIVLVNLALGIFNLVPLPPLDGSKIVFSLLPESASAFMYNVERYSFILLIVFVMFFADILSPVLAFLFQLFTGLPFLPS